MDPNTQYPGSPQGNPYDFILNPQQPPKKKIGGIFRGNRFLMTVILIVGGVFLLMVIVAILLNALAPAKISKDDLIGIVQTQHEIHRIAAQASSNATQQTTKNLATTVEYTMITQQKQTLEVLAKNNVEPGEEQLALKQNATTDQKFASAKSTSTYDQTFTEIIQDELTSYANNLKDLSAKGASRTERNRMGNYYRQVQQLISQVPYTQDKLDSASQPR